MVRNGKTSLLEKYLSTGKTYLGFGSELLAPVRLLQLLRAERLGARLALGQRRLRHGRKDRLEAE